MVRPPREERALAAVRAAAAHAAAKRRKNHCTLSNVMSNTNVAFGGPELKTAYITLSSKGELIAMDWPRPGLALNFLNK